MIINSCIPFLMSILLPSRLAKVSLFLYSEAPYFFGPPEYLGG
jgi:hypothetical protein